MNSRHNPTTSAGPASQRGMSLIEVLISVLILGIGMLGIAAMQAAALRNGQGSLQQSQAIILANTMMDALRANAANGTSYNMAMASSPCTPPANTGTVISSDKNFWIKSLQSSIEPKACGSISCVNTICTVTVQWNDNSAAGVENVVLQSRL